MFSRTLLDIEFIMRNIFSTWVSFCEKMEHFYNHVKSKTQAGLNLSEFMF